MPNTIDQNVVQMQFDNKDFEKNIQTSMLSLENLKRSLSLGNAASGLTSSIETISNRFSTLGIIGITALQNITNRAINAGSQVIKSLTVDPVKTGLSEYEEKINSVQTILMGAKNKDGTAVSLGQVKDKLEELNTYADKTIYSFQDMTSNIGKFTNAGVDLDTSVAAIQGVANVAAVSGANAQQASHAMYNFAQALSSGYVKLIDWKSIETAGMATTEFKDQLLEAGVAAGTLEKTSDGMYKVLTKNGQGSSMDQTINATKNFNDSLGYQWMTTEVLTSTLGKYSDASTDIGKKAFAAAQDVKTFTQLLDTLREAAQSGWAMTMEYIVGDFDQAKKLWTGVSKEIGGIIDKQAEDRNKLIKGWAEGGGRDALLSGIKNSWNAFMDVATDIKEAFREVFPATTSERLVEITKAFEKFTEKLQLSDASLEKLNAVFRGVFSVFDIVIQAISAVVRALLPATTGITAFADGVLGVTGTFGDYIFNLDQTIKKNDTFYKTLKTIIDAISGSEPFRLLISGLHALSGGFSSIAAKADQVKEKIKEFFSSLTKESTDKTSKAGSVLGTLLNILSKLGTALKNTAKIIGDTFVKAFEGFDLENAQGLVNGGILTAILLGIGNFVKGLKEKLGDLGGGKLLDSVKEVLSGVQDSLQSFQDSLKASTLLKIAAAIGILAISLIALAGIDPDKMANAFAGITGLFADLMGSMALFNKISGNSKGLGKATSGMIKMSVAVLILALAMDKLASIPWDGLKQGLLAVTVLSTVLVGTAILLGKYGDKNVGKASKGMITMSIAINILTSAVKKLADMDPGALATGLIGVGALLGELAAFLTITDFDGMGISSGAGILLVATAIKSLSKVVQTFAEVKPGDLVKSIAAIGALLLEIGIFANIAGKADGILASSVALVIMASGLRILTGVLASFGGMSFEQIGKGLLVLAASLGTIVIALNLMTGGLAGAAAIMIVAASLNLLLPVLNAFSEMSIPEIAKSLGMLAGILLIFGVAGMALAPVAPALLLVSAALALLGVGIVAIGAGLLTVSLGLTAFAAAMTANAASIVASIGLLITGIVGFVPLVATAIAQGILTFATTILSGTAQLVSAAVTLGTALLNGIASLAPALVNTGMTLLMALLQGVMSNIGQITVMAGLILINFITGIAAILPGIIEAGINLIVSFIDGLAQGINDNGQRLVTAFMNLFKSIGNLLLEELAQIAELIPGVGEKIADSIRGSKLKLDSTMKPGDAKAKSAAYAKASEEGIKDLPDKYGETGTKANQKFGDSISKGDISAKANKIKKDATKPLEDIVKEYDKKGKESNKALSSSLASGDASSAAKKVSKSSTIKVDTGKNSAEGRKSGESYAKGISASASKAKSAGAKVATAGVSGVKSKHSQFRSSGASSAAGIASGLDSKKGTLASKGRELANAVNNAYKSTLKVHSPSRVMMWNAQMTVMGLVKGLSDNLSMAGKSAGRVADTVKDALVSPLTAVATAFDGEFMADPVITPVLDMSNINRGINAIDSSLGMTRTLSVSPGLNAAAASINGTINSLQNGSSNADVVNAIGKLRRDIGNIQGNTYSINGITYDDGSNIHDAIGTLIRATVVEGRA